MGEKIEFRNNPLDLARDFVSTYSKLRPDWKETSKYPESKEIFQRGVSEMEPTQKIMWDMRSVGRMPHISAIVAEAILDQDFEQSERWVEQPEIIRSVLRVAVNMDLGDWRGIDVDRSMGEKVHKSEETISLEKFLAKLEEQTALSIGERRIS